MVATPLNLAHHPTHVVLGTLAARSIGSTAAIENLKKHAWYYGITTDFCRCNKSFVFANSETETCKESCILHFPTTPPCSTTVDVLETGDVPILFSFPQMRKLGVTVELNPEGDKITCPAFGLFSSPAEYSTVGHIVLDLTSLTHQPTTKSREQSGHPERHVVLAMSQGTPAYPAHALDRREDEYEDDKPLVRPDIKKGTCIKKRRDSSHTNDEDLLHLWFFRNLRDLRRPQLQDPTVLEQEVSRHPRERPEEIGRR